MSEELKRRRSGGSEIKRMAAAMAALRDAPLTSEELAVKSCMSRCSARTYLRALRANSLVHVSGWRKLSEETRHVEPVYAFGPGEDAKRPCQGEMLCLDILSALEVEDGKTPMQLAALLGMSLIRTKIALVTLRAQRKIYVSDWTADPRGAMQIPIYGIGGHQSKRKPTPPTHAQHLAKRRARQKQAASIITGWGMRNMIEIETNVDA